MSRNLSDSKLSSALPRDYYRYGVYQDDDELSLLDLWRVVWGRKRIVLVLGSLAAAIGVFYALRATEVFRAQVLMAPAFEEETGGGLSALASQFGGLASMAGMSLGGSGNVESAVATLKSRRFLNAFIEEKSLLPVLFHKKWDETTGEWNVESASDAPTLWDGYKVFSKQVLSVSEDKKSGLITLAIEWEDPDRAQAWANELVDRVNGYLRQEAKRETETNLEYLKKQLQQTQVLGIQQSLYTLVENQTQKAMLANAKKEYAFKVIDPAVVPEEKSKPKRALIVLSAGMLGGFLGICICFILHFRDTSRTDKKNLSTN